MMKRFLQGASIVIALLSLGLMAQGQYEPAAAESDHLAEVAMTIPGCT
jgi:hypothetical protein